MFAVDGKEANSGQMVIVNKGDRTNYIVRARLVAKHIVAKYGGKGIHDLFAAMPPFEMIKLLLVRAWSKVPTVKPASRSEGVRKIIFLDVSKAHLYALIDEDVNAFVDLPAECSKQGMCGRLNYWLYGMRPASKGWEMEYRRRLVGLGFRAGKASPCCFYRESDGVACVVHGDDFTFEGPWGSLRKLPEELKKFWLIKVRGVLGPDKEDEQEISILNRILRWT